MTCHKNNKKGHRIMVKFKFSFIQKKTSGSRLALDNVEFAASDVVTFFKVSVKASY